MDTHTGFGLGLLWTRRPDWTDSSYLRPVERRARILRANFSTWSWTSVTGEIHNDIYGKQLLFGAYLRAYNDISIQNDAYIPFKCTQEINQCLCIRSCGNNIHIFCPKIALFFWSKGLLFALVQPTANNHPGSRDASICLSFELH